jgi:putative ABC transport system substrate-binding protein
MNMRPRTAGLIFAFGILSALLTAEAQQTGKIARIGYLESGSLSAHPLEAFQHGLRELGHVEGQSIVIEYRAAEGKPERLADLAAELVRLKVDVIFAVSPPSIRAAKNATRTIPIVFAGAADPVASGFVASLARPGGNLTGLSLLGPELSGKRLELLKEVAPGITRVAVLLNPANLAVAPMLKETEIAARTLGLQLQSLEVRRPDELDRAFSAMTRERAGAFVVLPDATLHGQKRRIADLAAKNRLPAIYDAKDYVETGGLMAYGASFPDLWRRAAVFVDKILKGAKPADLPVEQPTRFELVINGKTAKALGLTIPQSILIRVDHVIQ